MSLCFSLRKPGTTYVAEICSCSIIEHLGWWTAQHRSSISSGPATPVKSYFIQVKPVDPIDPQREYVTFGCNVDDGAAEAFMQNLFDAFALPEDEEIFDDVWVRNMLQGEQVRITHMPSAIVEATRIVLSKAGG